MREFTVQDLQDIRENFPLESCLVPPDLTVSAEAALAFDQLFDAAREHGPSAEITYTLPYPKYLFLDYLASTRGLMLHGSNMRGIEVLRPIRYSSDSSEFGRQDAVFASQDPLWAMYFAVLDKTRMVGTSNGAIQLLDDTGTLKRYYYYTLDAGTLRTRPWIPGALYLLPGEGFEPDPEMVGVTVGSYKIQATHWIYRGEITPLARLNVEPEDFPFLDCVWGFDPAAFNRRMEEESLAGFPFLDDPVIYPIIPPDSMMSFANRTPGLPSCPERNRAGLKLPGG